MSRLDIGSKPQIDGMRPKKGPRHFSVVFMAAAAAMMAVAVSAVILTAFVLSSGVISIEEKAEISTTTTTSTTFTTATTSSSTSSSTTSSTTSSSSTTSTSSSTTSTTVLSAYQIASCMSEEANRLYIGDNIPSNDLRQYLGVYLTLFMQNDCRGEDAQACRDEIQEFIDDDRLYLGNSVHQSYGLPVVVKEGRAYLIPTVKTFDDLLGCGSLY